MGRRRGIRATSVLTALVLLAACAGGTDDTGSTAPDATHEASSNRTGGSSTGPAPACPDAHAGAGAHAPEGAVEPVRLRGAARAAVIADADWIVANQLDSGAIAIGDGRDAVWGYLANFAARGLSLAAAATGRAAYGDTALRWFTWYQDHQQPDGTVPDHRVSPDGTETSTDHVDAVDASAGTYLWALHAWWSVSKDRRGLASLAPSVRVAVDAIVALQDTDGLTWARADWRVKYLMDQAETYAGLVAATELAEELGLDELRGEAEQAARRLRAGVEANWDDDADGYIWAVHADGDEDLPAWTALFPDALQQIWAVAFGLACPEREHVVVDRFLAEHADWSAAPFVGWWAPVTWALEATDRERAAAAGLAALTEASTVTGRSWPFTPSDAGQLIESRVRLARP